MVAIVTEFGPPGVWETKKNAWGSAPEFTSTEKADYYKKGYEGAVLGSKGLCLGSYAFVWGAKELINLVAGAAGQATLK